MNLSRLKLKFQLYCFQCTVYSLDLLARARPYFVSCRKEEHAVMEFEGTTSWC